MGERTFTLYIHLLISVMFPQNNFILTCKIIYLQLYAISVTFSVSTSYLFLFCTPDTAVNCTMRAAYGYGGQKCSACSRLYVPESVWGKVNSDTKLVLWKVFLNTWLGELTFCQVLSQNKVVFLPLVNDLWRSILHVITLKSLSPSIEILTFLEVVDTIRAYILFPRIQ